MSKIRVTMNEYLAQFITYLIRTQLINSKDKLVK